MLPTLKVLYLNTLLHAHLICVSIQIINESAIVKGREWKLLRSGNRGLPFHFVKYRISTFFLNFFFHKNYHVSPF